MNHEQIRQDQMSDAARRAGSNNRDVRRLSPAKKQFVAKGHDAILKGVQDNRGRIAITTIGDGSEHIGTLIARDKYTITIKTNTGSTKTFYKHAIESFEPIQQVQ